MNTQPTLDFENNEEKKSQSENVVAEIPAVKTPRKSVRETTVDKFKAKKYILLGDIYNQVDAVLYHLQQEGSITSMDGFTQWGITRMSAVIHTLRHRHKIAIESEDLTIKNRFGHETTFSKYKLAKVNPAPQA